jgi:flagellar motor switch protein FliN/FliY
VPILTASAVAPTVPAPAASPGLSDVQRILRLQVPVIVKLAERKLSLSEVLRLGNGAIIEFSRASDEPLELMINNKTIGLGETVKVGENFGLRITHIGDVRQIIQSLGSGAAASPADSQPMNF